MNGPLHKLKPPPPVDGYLFPRLAAQMRRSANLSGSDMARRMNVSPSAVHQYEDPTRPITEHTLRAYAAATAPDVPFDKTLLAALLGLLSARAPADQAPANIPDLEA